MLSLWKLRVGAEAYYLSQVASGLDDYYSGRGETAGEWLGCASSALGVSGEVSAEDLRAVLAGLNPATGQSPNGERLRVWKNRVPGFDLTFSAPKSVSVVYALGDPLVRAAVVDAHEAAVVEALGWLEREACWVRRGSNNAAAYRGDSEGFGTRRLRGAGFVAAGFGHRVSRAGDPQVHTHVLVANLTRGPDGRWSALDAQVMYRARRAAGAVYDAAVRAELSARLGVGWVQGRGEASEVAGVPGRVVEVFSKRRNEIEAEMAAAGLSGAKAAAQVTLDTRAARAPVDTSNIDQQWVAEAAVVGFTPADLDAVLAAAGPVGEPVSGVVVAVEDPDTGERRIERVRLERLATLVAERLADTDSSFTRHQVSIAVAQLCPGGTTVAGLERLTAAVLADDEFIACHPDVDGIDGEQRWTTRTMLRLEADLLDAFQPTANRCGMVDVDIVDRTLAGQGASLGQDQLDAVRRLVSQGLGVEVVVGRAGTGKTHVMNTVRAVYEAAGFRLVGVAPSALAARGLAAGAGIESFTFPRFRRDILDGVDAHTVVVIDEAGMAGTVDLHRVVTGARAAGAKVILVGDHRQLPEVGAGGGFATAVNVLGEWVCELVVNRRQTEPWERAALDELRHGDTTAAYRAYRDHGRVTLAEHPEQVHRAAIGDWWAAHHAGVDALLLAGTRVEARVLNRAARQLAAEHGHLSGPTITSGGRSFQVGDRVVLTRNDTHQTDLTTRRRCRVDNGTRGHITALDPAAGTIDITTTAHARIRLDADYLAAGHLDHGYAVTIHKAQGVTCGEVFVVGPAGLTRQGGYVALSRARYGARLYATGDQHRDLIGHHHSTGLPLPTENNDPDTAIRRALDHTTTKQFATTATAHVAAAADLAARYPLDHLQHRLDHIRDTIRQLDIDGVPIPTGDAERVERARTTRAQLHVGGRVRAHGRDNLGTVVAIADQTGTAWTRFTNTTTGATIHRWMHWADITPVDHPEPIEIPPAARRYLTTLAEAHTAEVHQWHTRLAETGIGPDEHDTLTLAIQQRTTRLVHRLTADPPNWLQPWLGRRPPDPIGATVWDDEIRHLATWRDTHHTAAHVPGYGPPPTDPNLHEQWARHVARSDHNRTWLRHHTPGLAVQPVTPLDPDQIRTRLAELHEILATAPPDQRHITHALHTGTLQPADLHHALTAAHTTQRERRAWIIEHWPHVIEHAELTRLATPPTPTAAVGAAAHHHGPDPVTAPPAAAPAPPPPTARPIGPTLDLI